jgi:hypothetical protein
MREGGMGNGGAGVYMGMICPCCCSRRPCHSCCCHRSRRCHCSCRPCSVVRTLLFTLLLVLLFALCCSHSVVRVVVGAVVSTAAAVAAAAAAARMPALPLAGPLVRAGPPCAYPLFCLHNTCNTKLAFNIVYKDSPVAWK